MKGGYLLRSVRGRAKGHFHTNLAGGAHDAITAPAIVPRAQEAPGWIEPLITALLL